MIAMAAGLAAGGKTPFTASFAVFGTGRAYDQIRNSVCYPNLSVKVCPTHAGITVGPDGGSHQMIEDIALMRVLPNMRVLVPADFTAARAAIRIAAETAGPVYVRLGRAALGPVYEDGAGFELGRAQVLRRGTDVTLIACGVMVERALAAADLLAGEGVSAEVVDMFSIKPLDVATLLESVRRTGGVVTCEEHSVIGGMGSAVAEALGEGAPVPMERVGVQDAFGTSGEPEQLMERYGLTSPHIVAAARRVLQRL
jgi:transketolase